MNYLQRSLIEKTGYHFGFEYVQSSSPEEVVLASARHPATAIVIQSGLIFDVQISSPSTLLINEELTRSFPMFANTNGGFKVSNDDDLGRLLRRAANLAHSLPNHAVTEYQEELERELGQLPDGLRGTEVEQLVRQRVGQQAYRNAMLEYWGGTCAVTGLSVKAALTASHAKPWAECDSDHERLNVFNGFLFSANLDALFDRFLISFDDVGELIVSPAVSEEDRKLLGLDQVLKLRWIAKEHLPYLKYHRRLFEKTGSATYRH
tara:strand:- start:22280 stop:23068 length:789 start_codon:yes stop_codon:yes gene_type:complete